MGYKKSQNIYNGSFISSTSYSFNDTFERINSNSDLGVKGGTTDFWIAQVVSGYSITSPTNGAIPASANPAIVDLGDSIPRYAVRVRIVSDVFFSGEAPISNLLENPTALADDSARLNWTAGQHPWAYTENHKVQIPSYGAFVAIREYGGVYFIERIINKTPTTLSGTGGASSSQNSFNGGSPPGDPPKVLIAKTDSPLATRGNMARYYGKSSKRKINMVILHATAGTAGPGRAKKTVDRMAGVPTGTWKTDDYPKGGKPCSDYPTGLPKGTICNERYSKKFKKKIGVVEEIKKVSIHYAVDQGANVIQGCPESLVAWHAGPWNTHSVGIEMNGDPYATKKESKKYGGTADHNPKYSAMYTTKLLDTVAELVADICKRNGLPIDRKHIVGHEQVPGTDHSDPGAGKNRFHWDDFMSRVRKYY